MGVCSRWMPRSRALLNLKLQPKQCSNFGKWKRLLTCSSSFCQPAATSTLWHAPRYCCVSQGETTSTHGWAPGVCPRKSNKTSTSLPCILSQPRSPHVALEIFQPPEETVSSHWPSFSSSFSEWFSTPCLFKRCRVSLFPTRFLALSMLILCNNWRRIWWSRLVEECLLKRKLGERSSKNGECLPLNTSNKVQTTFWSKTVSIRN